jgi:hypothetical protein
VPAVVTENMVQRLLEGTVGQELSTEILALYPFEEYGSARDAYIQMTTDAQFTCNARRAAVAAASSQDQPVYRYFFTRTLPSGRLADDGAFHGLELFYIFQHIDTGLYPGVEQADLQLQEKILGYWARFAATGDPNDPAAIQWPVYDLADDPYLELGAEIKVGHALCSEICDLWDTVTPWDAPVISLATAPICGDEIVDRITSLVYIKTTMKTIVSALHHHHTLHPHLTGGGVAWCLSAEPLLMWDQTPGLPGVFV